MSHSISNNQLEAMEEMKKQDRIIELTYQVCVKNNEVLFGYTPMFDILDGKYKAPAWFQIRATPEWNQTTTRLTN